tara:strand:- start:3392 stop:3568 length:177 start_codon:yes stop_codon:yes gene_type:complete
MRIDLQKSKRIKEHLKELKDAYDKSKNKPILREYIRFWKQEYKYKLEIELIRKQQLNK